MASYEISVPIAYADKHTLNAHVDLRSEIPNCLKKNCSTQVKVFRIIPVFRILKVKFNLLSSLIPQNPKLSKLHMYDSFPELFSIYQKTFEHLNLKLLMFCRLTASF